jgi:hypothetical protein
MKMKEAEWFLLGNLQHHVVRVVDPAVDVDELQLYRPLTVVTVEDVATNDHLAVPVQKLFRIADKQDIGSPI